MPSDIPGQKSFVSHMQGRLAEQTGPAVEKSAKAGARPGWDALFVPDSVAVIGATERCVGETVLSESCDASHTPL